LGNLRRPTQYFLWCGLDTSIDDRFDFGLWLYRLFSKCSFLRLIDIFWRRSSIELKINTGLKSVWIEELGGCRTIELSVVYLLIYPLICFLVLLRCGSFLVKVWLKYFLYQLSLMLKWEKLLLRRTTSL